MVYTLFSFFKQKPDFPDGRPESSIDLRGAALEAPSVEKTKGKRYVFQVGIHFCFEFFQRNSTIASFTKATSHG